MRKFAEVKAFADDILTSAGYEGIGFYPGPELNDNDPNTYVIATRYGGPGLEGGEGALDGFGWQLRVVGAQYDYDTAEGVADALDIGFISHMSGKIGNLWVVEIARVGGPPAVLMVDDGNRTHFVCSYTASVESALAN